MSSREYDVIIVGAGIIGAAVAWQLKQRQPGTRIAILEKMKEERRHVEYGQGSMDAFGIYREGRKIEMSVLLVRQGRLFEARTYGFPDVEVSTEELLSSLVSQFYQNPDAIPENILLPLILEN